MITKRPTRKMTILMRPRIKTLNQRRPPAAGSDVDVGIRWMVEVVIVAGLDWVEGAVSMAVVWFELGAGEKG
jgi:hypothetical protein